MLYVFDIYIYSKYAQLQSPIFESGLKLRKIWVDQGNEFFNTSAKSWLYNNATYSTHNDSKSVIADKFIRNLRGDNVHTYDCSIKKCVRW